MVNYFDLLKKANDCIDSCKTYQQLDSCKRIMSNLVKSHLNEFTTYNGRSSDLHEMTNKIKAKEQTL